MGFNPTFGMSHCLEDLRVKGRIILKRILRKWGMESELDWSLSDKDDGYWVSSGLLSRAVRTKLRSIPDDSHLHGNTFSFRLQTRHHNHEDHNQQIWNEIQNEILKYTFREMLIKPRYHLWYTRHSSIWSCPFEHRLLFWSYSSGHAVASINYQLQPQDGNRLLLSWTAAQKWVLDLWCV